MSRKTWGIFLLVGAFLILGFVAYKNSPKRQVPIIFSPRTELVTLWEDYKNEYIEKDSFRVLDKQKESITTSEGQSYAMLRAVWMDDKTTFDGVWKFSKDNLQHTEGDKLFSWLFGKRADGSYGVLTDQGGQNSATDADTDIALALIFASARWNDQNYLNEAKMILDSVWAHEVVEVKGKPYLVANNIEKNSPTTMVVNPSYFSPYAYRVFAEVDSTHPWMKLVDTSYEVLDKSMAAPLDTSKSVGLPPDWVFLDKTNGAILPPTNAANLTTNFGYDALRTPWRIALDWQWFKEPRAKNTLTKMKFLSDQWNSNSVLYVPYKHNGDVVEQHQSAALYGASIGYFMVADEQNAKVIYDNKLQVLFNPDTNSWKVKLGYYDDNWVWFGIALYNNLLPNLAAK